MGRRRKGRRERRKEKERGGSRWRRRRARRQRREEEGFAKITAISQPLICLVVSVTVNDRSLLTY